jgi:hypothetical protein
MEENKRPNEENMTEVQKSLGALNLLYQAAVSGMPVGLVPAAREAQMKGLEEAGNTLVALIQGDGSVAPAVLPEPEK